jgi:hypothetical protein
VLLLDDSDSPRVLRGHEGPAIGRVGVPAGPIPRRQHQFLRTSDGAYPNRGLGLSGFPRVQHQIIVDQALSFPMYATAPWPSKVVSRSGCNCQKFLRIPLYRTRVSEVLRPVARASRLPMLSGRRENHYWQLPCEPEQNPRPYLRHGVTHLLFAHTHPWQALRLASVPEFC